MQLLHKKIKIEIPEENWIFSSMSQYDSSSFFCNWTCKTSCICKEWCIDETATKKNPQRINWKNIKDSSILHLSGVLPLIQLQSTWAHLHALQMLLMTWTTPTLYSWNVYLYSLQITEIVVWSAFHIQLFLTWYILLLFTTSIFMPKMQHKNEQVNMELWREAQLYGDIQLMPFVDYYTLITLKTISICIFGVCFLFQAFTSWKLL